GGEGEAGGGERRWERRHVEPAWDPGVSEALDVGRDSLQLAVEDREDHVVLVAEPVGRLRVAREVTVRVVGQVPERAGDEVFEPRARQGRAAGASRTLARRGGGRSGPRARGLWLSGGRVL